MSISENCKWDLRKREAFGPTTTSSEVHGWILLVQQTRYVGKKDEVDGWMELGSTYCYSLLRGFVDEMNRLRQTDAIAIEKRRDRQRGERTIVVHISY